MLNQPEVSFGWSHSTHKIISGRAVQRINHSLPPSMRVDIETLMDSCIAPDSERKKITGYIHGHFADIDNLSSNPKDAHSLLISYTHKAVTANRDGKFNPRAYDKRDKYLGYALHFLQDMLNPFHVVFKKLPKDDPERVMHKKFEKFAQKIQEEVLARNTLSEKDSTKSFFSDSLPEAMRHTKNLWNKINYRNSTDFQQEAAESLKTTQATTDLYLKKMLNTFLVTSPEHISTNIDLFIRNSYAEKNSAKNI